MEKAGTKAHSNVSFINHVQVRLKLNLREITKFCELS
jgi:hypothetical protein